jgi:hypothetical protein
MIISRPAAVNESRYFISPEETRTQNLAFLRLKGKKTILEYSALSAVLRLFGECHISGAMAPPEAL